MPRLLVSERVSSSIHLRLGTRGSPLARWQAEWVQARLAELEGVEVELVEITTQGDRDQRAPLGQIGGQGVFTKELQRALLDERIDLAVHSLKDLTTEAVEGLALAAVPPRESSHDCLLSRDGLPLAELPRGAKIGTGSTRRRAQLLHERDDLQMLDIRGNVDTRLRKLHEGQYDALILAEAGLRRLGLTDHITQILPKTVVLPAVGQGALGIETRREDRLTVDVVAKLDDARTHATVIAERAMLATLRGGCLAPVGAWCRMEDERLHLTGVVLSPDGKSRLQAHADDVPEQCFAIGEGVARALVEQGADALLESARS